AEADFLPLWIELRLGKPWSGGCHAVATEGREGGPLIASHATHGRSKPAMGLHSRKHLRARPSLHWAHRGCFKPHRLAQRRIVSSHGKAPPLAPARFNGIR